MRRIIMAWGMLLVGALWGASITNKPILNLPGTENKFDTEGTIKKLVEVRRIPILQKQQEIQNLKIENQIIQDFVNYLRELDNKSKKLYSFESPFGDKLAESSDESSVSAIAQRKAKKDTSQVKVIQIAQADSFASRSVSRSESLPAGDFSLTMGETTVKVRFRGGNIYQLAEQINQQASEIVEAKVVADTPFTGVLVISGKKTGQKNKLIFSGNLDPFFSVGLLKVGEDKKERYTPSLSRTVAKKGKPLISESQVTLSPVSEGEIVLSDSPEIKENTTLIFSASITQLPEEDSPTNYLLDFPIEKMESVQISNVTVEGGSLIVYYEEPKAPPVRVSNFQDYLILEYSDGQVQHLSPTASGVYSNKLIMQKGKRIVRITFKNENTDKQVTIQNISLETVVSEGGIQPGNPVSKAQDAIFTLDGIEVTRDKNDIDDVIDGVVLTLKNPSSFPARISVDHDYEKIYQAILDWVHAYNQVMEYLAIATAPDKDRTPLSERSQETLRNGVFQADVSFNSLRSKLRTIIQNAYPGTDISKGFSSDLLFEQIGSPKREVCF
ncbi:flagellar filament capping protein FliD [Thermospira aquatica]|uniref:Flagellar hook-associated protein 2 n=1 Tax=Thermospira aquatica TaxID=2828656 RepID=A0AAX3BBD1_9SPIR|nr:flagellar filament capping protein FliD [Thermospira aquatica]URA09554.1 flagellar filament capping protein FliD [Thermospira aquatica]